MKRYHFIHASMYGSYWCPCKILRSKNDKHFIEYTDPWVQEVQRHWVDKKEVYES